VFRARWQHVPACRKPPGPGKLDLLIVADPHPTPGRARRAQENGTYLLPICHAVLVRRLSYRLEPLNPVVRADRQAIFEIENDYE